MVKFNPSLRQQAILDCYLQYGGNVKATVKALNSLRKYSRCGPIVVHQTIATMARFDYSTEPEPYRIQVAKVLDIYKGDTARIPPGILAAADELGMDPQCFRSNRQARSKPAPAAPDCPHCGLSDSEPRSNQTIPNRWICLGCAKDFRFPKQKPGRKPAQQCE